MAASAADKEQQAGSAAVLPADKEQQAGSVAALPAGKGWKAGVALADELAAFPGECLAPA